MINVRNYLKILRELKITQSQYLLLHCLYYKLYAEISEYRDLFPTEDGSAIGGHWFNDLVDKGYIKLRVDPPQTMSDFIITDLFTKIFINDVKAFDEIKALYPDYMNGIGNKQIPLLTGDEDELLKIYYEKIGGVLAEHIEVKEDLAYMVQHNRVAMGLEKFIKSKGWLSIRKERYKDNAGVTKVVKSRRRI